MDTHDASQHPPIPGTELPGNLGQRPERLQGPANREIVQHTSEEAMRAIVEPYQWPKNLPSGKKFLTEMLKSLWKRNRALN